MRGLKWILELAQRKARIEMSGNFFKGMPAKHILITLSGIAFAVCLVIVGIQSFQKGTVEDELQKCRMAAELGDVNEQTNLGYRYAMGDGVEKNLAEAAKWWHKAANQGHPTAQNNLGVCYATGKGCKKDVATAIKWFQKAAEQGNSYAQYNLGGYYLEGVGVEKDMDEAIRLWSLAIKQGNTDAQTHLGWVYAEQFGAWKAAEYRLRSTAKEGNRDAQLNLGFLYTRGYIAPPNGESADKWLEAAKQQEWNSIESVLQNVAVEARAQTRVGVYYLYGLGIPQDTVEAVKWFRKAAEQGYAHAQYHLAWCYNKGEGVEQNIGEAVKWFRKAAEQGSAFAQYELDVSKNDKSAYEKQWQENAMRGSAEDKFKLGLRYNIGDGVNVDRTEAERWYFEAAEKGHTIATSNLGLLYAEKFGMWKEAEGVLHCCLTQRYGDKKYAQLNLGVLYSRGYLPPVEGEAKEKWLDLAKGNNWQRDTESLRFAWNVEDKLAQCNFGLFYLYGLGVNQSASEAVKWFRKAAEQGYAHAQYHLGWCYATGEGVEKDIGEAVRWYQTAEKQGSMFAKYELKRLGDDVVKQALLIKEREEKEKAEEAKKVAEQYNDRFKALLIKARKEREKAAEEAKKVAEQNNERLKQALLIKEREEKEKAEEAKKVAEQNSKRLMAELNRRLNLDGHTFQVTSLLILEHKETASTDNYRLQMKLDQPLYLISKTQSSWQDENNQKVRIGVPSWTTVKVLHQIGEWVFFNVRMNKSSNRSNPDGIWIEEEDSRATKTQDDVNKLVNRGFVILAGSSAEKEWASALNGALELKRAQYMDEKLRRNDKQAAKRYNENKKRLDTYLRDLRNYVKDKKGQVYESLMGMPRAPSPKL